MCTAFHNAILHRLAIHSQKETVIMGIFDPCKVASAAHVPNDQSVSAFIAVGHPATDPRAPKCKTVDELLTYRR